MQLTNQKRLDSALDQATQNLIAFMGQVGTFTEQFRSQAKVQESQASEVKTKLTEAGRLLEDSQQRLADITKEKEQRDKEIVEATSTLKALVSESDRKTSERLSSVAMDVESLKGRVFDAGSFLIREHKVNVINTINQDANQDIMISAAEFSGNLLRLFRMTTGRGEPVLFYTIDARGNPAPKPIESADLTVGSQIDFRLGGYQYSLTVRYIQDIRFNNDDAGIDITWTKLSGPGLARVN